MQFFNQPTLRVNLSSVNFKYNYPIRTDMVEIPGGINADVLEILSPDSVMFLLDERIELELPVHPLLQVDTAPGFAKVGDVDLKPSIVILTGPKENVQHVKYIKTDSVFITEAKHNKDIFLNLVKPNIYNVKLTPLQVKASVRIERIGEKIIAGITIKVKNVPGNRVVLVEPGSIEIQINGAISIIAGIDKDDIEAWVDYRDYNKLRSNRIPVRLGIKAKVDIIRTVPEDVRLIVRRH